jgi:hypothetical protein
LSGCPEGEHELRSARNKKATPYIVCGAWGNSTVFFRSPTSNEFLDANNGGSLPIENPIEADDEPLPRTPRNPNFEPTVAAEFACGTCKVDVQHGDSFCPNGHPLEWDQANPLQRAEGRVESDVQRLLKKIEREANGE